jgi:hypothetical protein
MANAQNHYIIWIVPKDSSALPINNTITGNAELNKLFKDFQIEKYYYLDEVNFGSGKKSVYEIHLKKEYAHWGNSLLARLRYINLFEFICCPSSYYNAQPYSLILLESIDPTALPCSATRSCNDELNAILDKHNVIAYERAFPYSQNEFLLRIIMIAYSTPNPLGLYNDLNSLSHLLKNAYIQCSDGPFPVSVNFEEPPSIVIYPNPVQDVVTISGINSQSITLYDAQGRMLLTKTNNFNKINMRHLSHGLYFLKIITDTGTVYVEKLIKQ